MSENILDTLSGSITTEGGQTFDVPKRCQRCKNIQICNIIATVVGMRAIGVAIEIPNCKYYNPDNSSNESKINI